MATIRFFKDEESITAAVASAKEKTDQIITDFDLTPSEHTRAEAAIEVTAAE